jgi:hypothetical protein
MPAGRPEAEGDLIQHGRRLGRQRLACAGGAVEPLALSSGKRGWGGGESVAVPAGASQALPGRLQPVAQGTQAVFQPLEVPAERVGQIIAGQHATMRKQRRLELDHVPIPALPGFGELAASRGIAGGGARWADEQLAGSNPRWARSLLRRPVVDLMLECGPVRPRSEASA